ncbi:hypothetical protein EXIGLDRAFT_769460 [Exidia glandulosa HHB12029]|uniref:Uncharacterized protein n=1 Tax=Exidia glandulosa HHB12029 TaxID=1314781 RepID=A0A166AHP0_EXIGL|nr:hypothetical protein EXIGLDRAFT_769460 [Exidia glandulosa HHB12029]
MCSFPSSYKQRRMKTDAVSKKLAPGRTVTGRRHHHGHAADVDAYVGVGVQVVSAPLSARRPTQIHLQTLHPPPKRPLGPLSVSPDMARRFFIPPRMHTRRPALTQTDPAGSPGSCEGDRRRSPLQAAQPSSSIMIDITTTDGESGDGDNERRRHLDLEGELLQIRRGHLEFGLSTETTRCTLSGFPFMFSSVSACRTCVIGGGNKRRGRTPVDRDADADFPVARAPQNVTELRHTHAKNALIQVDDERYVGGEVRMLEKAAAAPADHSRPHNIDRIAPLEGGLAEDHFGIG